KADMIVKVKEPQPKEIAKALKIPVQKVRQMLEMDRRPRSLHSSIDGEGVNELIKVIEDVDTISPSKLISDEVVQGNIAELLDKLSAREAGILKMRFGLQGCSPSTLTVIGKRYRITRERVRQIQEAGLRKLKAILAETNRGFHDF
ncbi:MAG TPA: sigma factor-like helix-turn-helix DNA-binding protein, partial [bacterium]|nr:sigma factor-like helix-turn-helix DNA-binding protein [bacterium]